MPLAERAADAVAERRDLDHRRAERRGEDGGERGGVGGDRLHVGGDGVDPLELGVDVDDRRGHLAEERHGLVGDAADELARLDDHLAELHEHDRDEEDQYRPEDGDDEAGDLATGQTAARECVHQLRCSSSSRSPLVAPRRTSRSAASRWAAARSAPCSLGR